MQMVTAIRRLTAVKTARVRFPLRAEDTKLPALPLISGGL